MTATATIPESQTVSVRTKQIGDTLLIIESAVSTDAMETAYNKIKRLILDHADRCDQPPRAAEQHTFYYRIDRLNNLTSSQ